MAAHSLVVRNESLPLDDLVDELGRAAGSRLTVVSPDGTVLADSELDGEALANVENHSQRPEILVARATGRGSSNRYSTTVKSNMLYVAILDHATSNVVRASMHTREVTAALAKVRFALILAAGLGLLITLAVGGLASHLAVRTLRRLAESARSLEKHHSSRVQYENQDELGVLAGSLNSLAWDLEKSVGRLARERDRLKTVLRGTSEGILAVDEQLKIQLVNDAATRLLSLPEDVEGRPLLEARRDPELVELAERGLGETSTSEFRLQDKLTTLMGRADPLSATGGAVIVLHDVTEIRQLEAVRRDFVTNVSHELRTPVAVIRATTETLLGGALDNPEARQNFVEAIDRNAHRLEALISDLLDLARVESGKQPVQLVQLLAHDVGARVVTMLERKAGEKGLVLVNELDRTLAVVADARAFEQVLVNLVENAVKYTEDGGDIRIAAKKTAQGIRIEVKDTGSGIPEAARLRVFERFYRVDTGRGRELGGTGLGLSIVKHLVQLMGGDVGVAPNQPKGSVFWFTLPAAPQD